MTFNPTLGQLACPYCGSAAPISTPQQPVQEQQFSQFANAHHTEIAALTQNALEVECGGCRAQITFQPPDVAGNCPFCNTHITAQPHAANPVITPEGILPFALDQKTARQRLTTWLKSRWFAPSSLKQLAQHETIQGVYLPFWTFDCGTTTQYRGERGTHYYVTKTRQVQTEKGKWTTETYQEQRTRWHNASGQVQRSFDDVLIPGVQSVKVNHLQQLMPWSLGQLAAYTPDVIRGFRAQRYQIDVNQGFEQAQKEMEATIRSDIYRDIGGDEQRIHSHDTDYVDKTFKHILLPVWMATYRYQNKPYQVLINGESGKVVGDRPFSVIKITLTVLAVITAVAAGFLIIGLFAEEPPPQKPSQSQPSMQQSAPSNPK